MNLVYRYLMMRAKETYRRGARYVLLKNYDSEPVYLVHARIDPGECFIMEESHAYDMLQYIMYEKRVVIVQSIQEDELTGEDGVNEDYRTTVI